MSNNWSDPVGPIFCHAMTCFVTRHLQAIFIMEWTPHVDISVNTDGCTVSLNNYNGLLWEICKGLSLAFEYLQVSWTHCIASYPESIADKASLQYLDQPITEAIHGASFRPCLISHWQSFCHQAGTARQSSKTDSEVATRCWSTTNSQKFVIAFHINYSHRTLHGSHSYACYRMCEFRT